MMTPDWQYLSAPVSFNPNPALPTASFDALDGRKLELGFSTTQVFELTTNIPLRQTGLSAALYKWKITAATQTDSGQQVRIDGTLRSGTHESGSLIRVDESCRLGICGGSGI